MQIKWDISNLPLKTREAMRRQRDDETVRALLAANERQKRIAEHHRNNPPRSCEGFGGQTMAFDPVVLAGLRRACNMQPGEQGKIMEWAARKWPGLYGHRHQPTRLQIGYGSTPEIRSRDVAPSRPGVRFSRVYEQIQNQTL